MLSTSTERKLIFIPSAIRWFFRKEESSIIKTLAKYPGKNVPRGLTLR